MYTYVHVQYLQLIWHGNLTLDF